MEAEGKLDQLLLTSGEMRRLWKKAIMEAIQNEIGSTRKIGLVAAVR